MNKQKYVIIDVSAMLHTGWLQHLQDQLDQWHQSDPDIRVNLYCSDHFVIELISLCAVFDSNENSSPLSIIDANIHTIFNELPYGQKLLEPNKPNEEITDSIGPKDIWDLTVKLYERSLQEESIDILLYTADILLIDRIVCHNMSEIAIYHTKHKRIINQCEWGIENMSINNDTRLVYPNARFQVSEGTKIYDQKGNEAGTLDTILFSGAESMIFSLKETPHKAVKVYFTNSFEQQKLENIKKICRKHEEMGIKWAIFPDHIAYLGPKEKNPIGFVMEYRATGRSLEDDDLYTGLCESLSKQDLNRTVRDSLDLCRQVLNQTYFLSQNGFLVSDYSRPNFAYLDSSPFIQMWDVDSFGYGTYFSYMQDSVHLTRTYDSTSKEELIEKCNELAYIFAFLTLTIGDTPLDRRGVFVYDLPNYAEAKRKELVPKNVWVLFEKVFRKEVKASIPALLVALEAAKKDPICTVTYRKLLSQIGFIDSHKIIKRIMKIFLLLGIVIAAALTIGYFLR